MQTRLATGVDEARGGPRRVRAGRAQPVRSKPSNQVPITMNTLKLLGCITTIAMLAACATAPPPNCMELKRVRTIAVVKPPRPAYGAGSASAPLVIPGGGAIGAAIGGAIPGGVNAARDKQAPSFDDVVVARLGDTQLTRRFLDAMESELKAHGFVVSELDLAKSGMPTLSTPIYYKASLKRAPLKGADAILVVRFSSTYFAPGPLNAYRRQIVGTMVLFKADTYEPLYSHPYQLMKLWDDYT
jgi:hypothetical protein